MAKEKVVLSGRLEREYVEALTKVAKARGISRSQLLREIAANAESLYSFLESERNRQQSEILTLDGNLSRWILNNMPKDMTAEWLDFIGDVMKHASAMKRIQEVENEG
jgi:hypothetical protein